MLSKNSIYLYFSFLMLFSTGLVHAQPVPAIEENIPFLVTFGKFSETSWGDDDFIQIFYFQIPDDHQDPIYIRVFDPDCGGEHDEGKGDFNTRTKYSIYGGEGCIGETLDDAEKRKDNPEFDYNSGELLATKVFAQDEKYDDQWYTFGPFTPLEGKKSEKYGGTILKMVCQGMPGDDGNLYRYFMSSKQDENVAVEGGNAFTFEYTFRLHSDPNQISSIFPYVDEDVVSVKQSNFDWDDDGKIKLISNVTIGYSMSTSSDDNWQVSTYVVDDAEKGKSLKIEFQKSKITQVRNNNVVFNIVNQYGEMMPNYTVPIGGVPEYKGKPKLTSIRK